MRRRRLTPVSQIAIAATFLWLLAIAGISQANAAQLTVMVGNEVKLYSLQKCADADLQTTVSGTASGGDYSAVELSGIPAGCQQGQSAELFVHDASGTLLTSGTTTLNAAAVDVSTGAYAPDDVENVVVRIDGWVFPTTWTPPGPLPEFAISCVSINNGGNPTGQPCEVTVTGTTYWDEGGPYNNLQIEFDVDSGQNRYEVTIDYSDSLWPGGGFTPLYVGSSYNIINAPGYSCGELPIHRSWKAAGNVPWENNGVVFASDKPGNTNGTTQLCP